MPPVESGQSPKLNLPPPVMETGGADLVPGKTDNDQEKLATSLEAGNTSSTPPLSNPPVQQVDFPIPTHAPAASASVASSTTNIAAPSTADDGDLIEKEWVIKAKKIVDVNRDNPYDQSQEMTVFKADYMKKRYNKIIKISE